MKPVDPVTSARMEDLPRAGARVAAPPAFPYLACVLPRPLLANPRARVRNERPLGPAGRCVVYWMQRAQRASDNPALDAAIETANELKLPLAVFLGLVPFYPNANERHYAFLIDGLPEIAEGIERRGAAFVFSPYPRHSLIRFCRQVKAAIVIGDENPLREPERWRTAAAARLAVPLVTVDADVVVPSALFAAEEYAARTIRPKIHAVLDGYLVAPREPKARVRFSPSHLPVSAPVERDELLRSLPLDRSAGPVPGVRGGTAAGRRALAEFVRRGLALYPERRNRPEIAGGTSGLSPYLHFGHVGPRGVALAVREAAAPAAAKKTFLEELIVRRELAINFVARNPRYDAFDGLQPWARRTLSERACDPREHLHPERTLEAGETHDPLWNAAQREMVVTGRMHGYMRMYWAKKILEWTRDPAEAIAIALRLNDRYELDGRDPNGYAGVAWAIGGKHDRPWGPRRPIFGLVRYMSHASTSRKFGSRAYIARVEALVKGAGIKEAEEIPAGGGR